MNLMEINEAIEKLEAMDLDPETLKDTLDSLEVTRDEKLDGIASWIEKNSMQVDWLIKKEKAVREAKSSLIKRNQSLMDYLTFIIDQTGYKELKTENHIFKPRNYRASTVVDDETKLPKKYLKSETVYKVDKTAIYNDLKDGQEVPGAYLKANRKTRIL